MPSHPWYRPQLTLRDLFALVAIVALALGWWLDRSRQKEENRQLLERNFDLKRQVLIIH